MGKYSKHKKQITQRSKLNYYSEKIVSYAQLRPVYDTHI